MCLNAFPFLRFYDVQCVGYTPMCVPCAQYAIRISRIAVLIPDCLYMLFISRVESSTCLPTRILVRIGKCHFFRIYLFVSGVLLCFVLCCVSCSECYFYLFL
jgi:hypothetical protein